MGERRSGALLVASTGGHLEELHLLAGTLADITDVSVPSGGEPVRRSWVTFDSPQSRALLAGEADVVYLPRVGSRGYVALLRALVPAWRTMRRVRPRVVVSTGAGIALAFLPWAPLFGARAVYVESAARTDAPSWTGTLLARLPWIGLRTQYRSWAHGRWTYVGSVFDGWRPQDRPQAAPVRRVVVTLGTQEGYPFTALVGRLRAILPPEVSVRWQVGPDLAAAEAVDRRSRAGRDEVAGLIAPDEMAEWLTDADVVVAHAGVGSALAVLGTGAIPVLVPRRAGRGEHVDDHQELIAADLTRRGLAVTAEATDLSWDDLRRAAAQRAVDTHTRS